MTKQKFRHEIGVIKLRRAFAENLATAAIPTTNPPNDSNLPPQILNRAGNPTDLGTGGLDAGSIHLRTGAQETGLFNSEVRGAEQ